jgi:hypothetical protein
MSRRSKIENQRDATRDSLPFRFQDHPDERAKGGRARRRVHASEGSRNGTWAISKSQYYVVEDDESHALEIWPLGKVHVWDKLTKPPDRKFPELRPELAANHTEESFSERGSDLKYARAHSTPYRCCSLQVSYWISASSPLHEICADATL